MHLKTLIKQTRMNRKVVNKCVMTLKKILPKGVSYEAQPKTYLQSILKKLRLSKPSAMLALFALKKVQKLELLECQQPQTVAAVAASLAVLVTREAVTLEEIAALPDRRSSLVWTRGMSLSLLDPPCKSAADCKDKSMKQPECVKQTGGDWSQCVDCDPTVRCGLLSTA